MIADLNKIRAVILAYCQIINQEYGVHMKASPPANGKHYENCLAFYALAEENEISIQSLMLACLDYFPPWWCQKIFKRAYPMVTVLVSEKSRARGLKSFPRAAEGGTDRLAEFYAKQLSHITFEQAEAMIESGFLGGDDVLAKQIMQLLQKEEVA